MRSFTVLAQSFYVLAFDLSVAVSKLRDPDASIDHPGAAPVELLHFIPEGDLEIKILRDGRSEHKYEQIFDFLSK